MYTCIHVYKYTCIDQICVEVFEKTIRGAKMIDHSFERNVITRSMIILRHRYSCN